MARLVSVACWLLGQGPRPVLGGLLRHVDGQLPRFVALRAADDPQPEGFARVVVLPVGGAAAVVRVRESRFQGQALNIAPSKREGLRNSANAFGLGAAVVDSEAVGA